MIMITQVLQLSLLAKTNEVTRVYHVLIYDSYV